MKLNGIKHPRVAVQALNPHAEFGTEEKDEIIPAIEEAKKLGINADGPLPCDTSFITAYKNKNHDCIVGMYHDALQAGYSGCSLNKSGPGLTRNLFIKLLLEFILDFKKLIFSFSFNLRYSMVLCDSLFQSYTELHIHAIR